MEYYRESYIFIELYFMQTMILNIGSWMALWYTSWPIGCKFDPDSWQLFGGSTLLLTITELYGL